MNIKEYIQERIDYIKSDVWEMGFISQEIKDAIVREHQHLLSKIEEIENNK